MAPPQRVLYTGLPTFMGSNAFAFDGSNNRNVMYWLYQDQNQSSLNGMYYWDHGANWGLINSSTALGIPASLPPNAAFFAGSF